MNSRVNKLPIVLFLFISNLCIGQIKVGKIIYERKINLEKEYKNDASSLESLKNNKIKIEEFELYFNDTCSIFKHIISDIPDKMSWATKQNTTYQNLNSRTRTVLMNVLGQEIIVNDTLVKRNWKITDSKRMIGAYDCRKAIWYKNDSTRIYAWYSTEIIANTGPEGFSDLPGTILGLATEDGGIAYFAKSVEILIPTTDNFLIDTKKKKVYTPAELNQKLIEKYGITDQGKNVIERLLRWL